MTKAFTKILVLALTACRFAYPQGAEAQPGQSPTDWRASLARIRGVAQRPCEQSNDTACATVALTQKVAAGLAGQWSRPGWPRPELPKEYADNLDLLATQLEGIARNAVAESAPDVRLQSALSFINKDLQAKLDDCLKFGMGRVIPVTVRTLLPSRVPDPGWEVFYTCSLDGQLGTEMRAGLTEITVRLPPSAVCTFRARKGDQQVQVQQVGLFGQDAFPVEIQVP